MKAVCFLFSLLLLMSACNDTNRTFNVPDNVEVSKTSKHRQIPGSRLFIVPPPGYKLSESNTLKNKEGDEIMIMDNPGKSFEKERRPDKESETTFFEKKFTLGGYNSIISYGKQKQDKEEKIILRFGDEEFNCLAICSFSSNKITAREELVASLLTMFLDKSSVVDYTAFSNYTLNLDSSSFKFNRNIDQVFCYTVNGKGEIYQNYISIIKLPALPHMDDLKDGSKEIIRRTRTWMNIEHIEEKEVNINGQPAYETIITGKPTQGTPQSIYILMISNTKSSLYYQGTIDADKPELFEDCKALAQTIRLK